MIKKTNSMERILFTINDRNNYGFKIARVLKMTYSHIDKVIKDMEEEGLLEIEKRDGRKRKINLTEKGKRAKEAYIKLNRILSE